MNKITKLLKSLGVEQSIIDTVEASNVQKATGIFDSIDLTSDDDIEDKFEKIQEEFESKVEELAIAGASRSAAKKIWKNYNVMNTLYQSKASMEGMRVLQRDLSMKWKNASNLMYRCFGVKS